MTKDELLAENERLGAEIAAHRVLLAAVRELATVPKPANWREVDYLCNLETRLITLRSYAGHVDDVHPDIMVRVLHDRAKELREEAATPVRYEVRAAPADDEYRLTPKGIAAADGEPWTRAGVAAAIEPAPSGMQDPAPVARVITDSERTCPEANPDSGAHCHRDGDHGVHRDPDGKEWRTDGPFPCCEHCTPQCSAMGIDRSGHGKPCATPGCTSTAPVTVTA